MKKLLIIIPAFNEADTIGQVLLNLPNSIIGVDKIEKIIIDDGSVDNTVKVVERAGVKVIRHGTNKGVGAALATGIEHALKQKADIVVNIDADGQFDPREIAILILPILKGDADFVSGNRFKDGRPENMSKIKYWGNWGMSKLISYIAGQKFQDVSCGFRAYNREALLNLNLFGRFTYTQEMFLDMNFKNLKIKEVPVGVKYFQDRKSKVAKNLFIYTWKTLNIITRTIVYYKPFRFFGVPGMIFMLIGLGFAAFLIGHRLIIGAYSPYKAYGFIGGGLLLFGLLMVFIGLIADIIDKVRQHQEKLLYFEKKKYYKKNNIEQVND